ncbi:MAG TPA: hypothetical protein VK943_07040 [Arenibaculum sp.]|nr:hypothetical protein [Arenibaculum sp.]
MDVFDADTAAARSARLMQIANKGWMAWIGRATLGIRDMTEATRELAGCRSTADLLRFQRSWVETVAERGAADLRGMLDLMRAMTAVTVDAGNVERSGADPACAPVIPPVIPPAARAPDTPLPEAPLPDAGDPAVSGAIPEPAAPAAAEPERPAPVAGSEPAKTAKPARRSRARSAGTAPRRDR